MCGIAGSFNLKSQYITQLQYEQASLELKCRGPDDEGIESFENCTLISRRLSIIDLSDRAHMPMKSHDGQVILVYNGEIYNYKELKQKYLSSEKFQSNSDTEVCLKLYVKYGIKFLDFLNGQFAIAILDNSQQELLLIRDRLGIKPLYYRIGSDKKSLVFGSSVNPIIKMLPKVTPDLLSISSYFSFRYPIGERTFFNEIKKLLPGHYLKINFKIIEIKPYWNLKDHINKHQISLETAQKLLYEKLEKAVKYRMISDVPLGAYLSGGVDSSVIVALMTRLSSDPIKTYSIGFEAENEFKFSRMIAKKFNTDHQEIILSPIDYLNYTEKLIRHKGEPLGVPNEIPLYVLSKELKKDITVVLSGEGADEIFMGYGRIMSSPRDFRKISSKLPKKVKNLIFRWSSKVQEDDKSFVRFFLNRYYYHSPEVQKRIFLKDYLENYKPFDYFNQFFSKYINEVSSWDLHLQISYLFELIHLPNLLFRTDNSTMATSVEARVPFVDHTLVTFIMNLPTDFKLYPKKGLSRIRRFFSSSDIHSERDDIPKYILKRVFEDIIPKEILNSKKKGFPVPLNIWYQSEFGERVKENLKNSPLFNLNVFNKSEIIKLLNNDKNMNYTDSYLIWMILNLHYWYQLYFQN